ncbi:MAG: hypothetical protein K2R93_07020 [Gemmatimonadaceae bacterium]|nr:hypothetical protein [Gemmatimonadaceae bacterium]
MTPHAAFDAILRETLAEVEAAEAIDEADARQARDAVEQLRLRAAHLITRDQGGPWATGAAVQFAKEGPSGVEQSTVDIRFPELAQAVPPDEGPAAGEGRAGSLPRQGRRNPITGKRAG